MNLQYAAAIPKQINCPPPLREDHLSEITDKTILKIQVRTVLNMHGKWMVSSFGIYINKYIYTNTNIYTNIHTNTNIYTNIYIHTNIYIPIPYM